MSTAPSHAAWIDELDVNAFGAKILTVEKARIMAARGERSGWYVAPFATRWTVGRMADAAARYHVLTDDLEPLVFDTIWAARCFLAGLLGPGTETALLWRRLRQPLGASAFPAHGAPLARPMGSA